jgi:alpha-ketoglutarate-dependent taurine dioxygenase
MPDNPFHPDNQAAYRLWREQKLAAYPSRLEDLIVEVGDPRALTSSEREAIMGRCRKANMAIYASKCIEPDKDIPRKLGQQLGLMHLDSNLLADEDAISSLTVAEGGDKRDYIPYTNKPIKWHTDGYYNTSDRQIRGMLLHCVQSAAEGGDNALLDHDIAYMLLRDLNPDHIRAFMEPDVMAIPPRMDEDGVGRPEVDGPVFSILPSGVLHMRYTARTRSIRWKQTPKTLEAVVALANLLESDSPYIFRGRLEPGMGLICNNVLHDRSGFTDSVSKQRLLFRARYFDRIANT